jgi:hypothetical protein
MHDVVNLWLGGIGIMIESTGEDHWEVSINARCLPDVGNHSTRDPRCLGRKQKRMNVQCTYTALQMPHGKGVVAEVDTSAERNRIRDLQMRNGKRRRVSIIGA